MDKKGYGKLVARAVIKGATCWTAGYLIGGLLGNNLKEIKSPAGKVIIGVVGWIGGTVLGGYIGNLASDRFIEDFDLED